MAGPLRSEKKKIAIMIGGVLRTLTLNSVTRKVVRRFDWILRSSDMQAVDSPYEHFLPNRCQAFDGTKTTVWYITVATKHNRYLDVLLAMCRERAIILNVLGRGDTRLRQWGVNFGVKVSYVQDFLRHPPTSYTPSDLVIFCDAFDVFILQALTVAVARFKGLDTDVLFSAEIYCHPDKARAEQYPDRTGAYPFLCSGLFMGYGKALLEMLDAHPFKIKDDDQRYWTTVYLDNAGTAGKFKAHRVLLDKEASIFFNVAGQAQFVHMETRSPSEEWTGDITNHAGVQRTRFKTVVNTRTGTMPCFIHFNGSANLIPDFLSEFGYSMEGVGPDWEKCTVYGGYAIIAALALAAVVCVVIARKASNNAMKKQAKLP